MKMLGWYKTAILFRPEGFRPDGGSVGAAGFPDFRPCKDGAIVTN